MRVYVFCFTLTDIFLKFLPLPATRAKHFPPYKTTPNHQQVLLYR